MLVFKKVVGNYCGILPKNFFPDRHHFCPNILKKMEMNMNQYWKLTMTPDIMKQVVKMSFKHNVNQPAGLF